MKILAIDTSTDYLSLAISDGEKVMARYHRPTFRNHSRLIIPTISNLVKIAGLKIKDIDAFALSIGPGSFTGLRIGVVTVKALAYSLGKPIVTIPTLDVIARNAGNFCGLICPVIDARKSKIYACLYKSDGKVVKKISKYLLLPVEELLKKTAAYDKVLFLGDALGLVGCDVKIKSWYPKAGTVADLALDSLKKKKFTSPEALEPMYLYSRECDIKGI
jgi:tRNA threonylcarbamoyladenosine biosynthesis protein TsaB